MVVEIHEDQPLVEPGAAWIRELWLPAIHRMDGYGGAQYPASIGSTESVSMIRKLPTDFTSVTTATLVIYGWATQNYNLTITGRAGDCGENFALHTQNDTRNHALTANTFSCIDLVPILAAWFAALNAGDHIYINVLNNTVGIVTVYGLDLRYT